MKMHKLTNLFIITILGILFTNLSWSQSTESQYLEIKPGSSNGIRFWSSSSNPINDYKLFMGNFPEHKYGPVTNYSIKTSMSNHADRGWTWGVQDKTPVMAVNTQGKLQVNSWIKSMGRTYYFGNVQYLYGDNRSAIYLRSNHSTVTQLIFRDKENINYGRVYGSSNGANFGLLDGDGNWSYLAAKDNYTAFRINNSEKMRIRKDGKVGIGSNIDYSPVGYQLYVQGGVLTEKVRVALESADDWADYVFDDSYDLMPISDLDQFIKTHKHLPNVPSAEEVVDGGIDIAKMDATLLEKIEELTLYMIKMDKELCHVKAENKELKKLISENK